MNTDVLKTRLAIALCVVLAAGCQSRQYYFFKDKDLTPYRHVAAEIEQPCEPCCHEALPAPAAPICPETFEKVPLWDLSLQEAIGIAVSNSKIARRLSPAGPPSFLLDNAQSLVTAYDPAIRASGVLGGEGGIGVEAALAAFDAQLTASMLWERNERPINSAGFGEFIFARNFEQDRGTWQAELSKTNATGGRMFVRNNVLYEFNNNPTRAVPSDWTVNYEVGVTQPLLQGGGVMFNRIAGPLRGDGFTGATQATFVGGVMIARINEDISLVDFERAIRDMVFDVENAYWDLYVAYRTFDSARAGRDSALAQWRRVKALQEAKAIGGEAVLVAQSRSQYYRFVGDMESALCALLRAENRLRYVMGLPASDCRLIRPKDDPQRAKVVFDWCEIHIEAMARAVELRRQKWIIQRRELELIAFRNALLPRLDAVALYRWLGVGDQFIDPNGRPAPPFPGSDAFSTLTGGDYQEWQLGFNFSMPLGFRTQMLAVRNAQLQIARERARLEGQELELSHALSEAVRNVECNHMIAQRRLDELFATQEEVRQFAAIWESGVRKIGLLEVRNTDLIDAIAKRAVAETQFYRALADYNRAIAEVHFRKGSLLEYNRVLLAEGPWPQEAYADARDKALRRVSAWPLNYAVQMKPAPVSCGPYSQWEQPSAAEAVPPGAASQTPAEPAPSGLPAPSLPAPSTEKLPHPLRDPMPAPPSETKSGQPAPGQPGVVPAPPSAVRSAVPQPLAPVSGSPSVIAPTAFRAMGTAHAASRSEPRADGSWRSWGGR